MTIAVVKQKFIEKLKSFLVEERKFHVGQRCCLYIAEKDILLVHIQQAKNSIEILRAETLRYDDIDHLPGILTNLIKNYKLANVPTSWLLPFEDYQLFLIESLPVPKEEVNDALNYRLRSLLPYAIDEATIDYFQIPPKKSSPDHPLMAAVAVKTAQIRKTLDLILRSGLALTNITIPELALRNLSNLYEEDEKSTAVLFFSTNKIVLNITRKRTLYFTRNLTLTPTLDPNANRFEAFGLDLMRFFDYYQSQWRFPAPARLFIGSSNGEHEAIITSLNELLSFKVEALSLQTLPHLNLNTISTAYVLPFACALSEEDLNVAAND